MSAIELFDLIMGRTAIHQYSVRKKARSSPGQMTFDDLGGGKQMTFDDLGAGHWVTIGSEKGSEGNHGGHRVFIGDDGKMKTGKFAGQSMQEAFGDRPAKSNSTVAEPKPAIAQANPTESPIPIRDRRALADRLAAEGKAQSEIEDYLRARGVSISDAKRLSSQASETKPSIPDSKPSSPETKLVTPETKPGIAIDSRTNEAAQTGDQMGLFGDVTNVPKGKIELPSGGETKGKQAALFDTKGDPDQMMMFDDGVTPADRLMPEAKPSTPSEKATAQFNNEIAKGESPRAAAAAAQKKLDEDYEFARASDVRNAGEDLKGSARHKVNAWKNLEDAEKNGTAAEMVTRDQLLKNEPHNLFVHADRNPLTALAMHYALRAFPPKPGTGKRGDFEKDRRQYLEAYQSVKQKAEELATTKDSSEVAKAIGDLQNHVAGLIKKFRGQKSDDSIGRATATDMYNQTANDLVGLHKALATNWRANKTGVAGRVNDFGQAAKERYGDLSAEGIAEHAKDVMEGKSLNVTFGREKKQSNRFDPSEAYVKVARRRGGRDLTSVTSDANKATKHMVESMGIRGVQWGNSVTDDERKHHAAKAVEALMDLADVTGLHPKDIALDGKLGLAIGARGKGNASAHYEPTTQVINLTRASGVGALAHEWGHAFDHMLNDYGASRKDPNSSRTSGNYMSGDFQYPYKVHGPDGNELYNATGEETGLRSGFTLKERPKAEIRKAYQAWESASKPYRKRLKQVLQDAVKSGRMSAAKAETYWASDHEIFARTFERHVQHKLESSGRENTYLSGLGGDHPLWPTKEEASQMSESFDGIMATYRKHKHGSSEPVKYSRSEAVSTFAHLSSAREVAQWLIERYASPFR